VSTLAKTAKMSALAYVYDHIGDLPVWFRRLTPGQLEDIARLMAGWQLPNDNQRIVPMEEIERREILRAVAVSGGNVLLAAKYLKVGKTTLYKKLKRWGYELRDSTLLAQASALRNEGSERREHARANDRPRL
jgi:DNA-binding NtrC family response regulator